MKYICTNCNYIFDEFLDNADDVIQKVDNNTKCPTCEEYDTFQGIDEEVNYAKDLDNLQDYENSHIPQIEKIDENNIRVFIGKNEHPMGSEHRIYSISLFNEYSELIIEEFLHKDADPEAEFDISDLDDYEIRAKCNIHGVWGRKK